MVKSDPCRCFNCRGLRILQRCLLRNLSQQFLGLLALRGVAHRYNLTKNCFGAVGITQFNIGLGQIQLGCNLILVTLHAGG